MIVNEKNVVFDALFERAAAEWPDEVFIENIDLRDDKATFTTPHLYDLSELISHRYLKHSEEVIMRNLHDSIYGLLHSAARYCVTVRPRELRRSELREKFERRLRKTPVSDGWPDEAMKLIADYLADAAEADGRAQK
jgi:hypothetical protein